MMFDNIFNDKAIKELAGIVAEQEANRTAKEVLKEMNIKSIGLSEKLKDGINKVFKNEKGEMDMSKMSHEEMMEKAWKFIADMEIVEEKESLTDTGYLVGSLHQVRDAYYADLESGHDFADEDMEGFFHRHSISYQTN